MADRAHLDWPFFDDEHRALAARTDAWAGEQLGADGGDGAGDHAARCRAHVRALGEAGLLREVVPERYGGARDRLDVRSLCLIRETLARHDGLADFAFALQGLGSGAVTLFGTEQQKRTYLPRIARGESIAAFAISEEHAGSDLAAMRTTALRRDGGWVVDGAKTWISNAGIADDYVVFARMPELGDRAFGAFLIPAAADGLSVEAPIEVLAPHVLGSLRLEACGVTEDQLIGAPGAGLKVALATLDIFRPTVGAAALGFARRALEEALDWASTRHVFGRPLSEHQLTQARLADMAVDVDASALLVYRAAWAADRARARTTREAAMAKLFATEAAQRCADSAVQLLGGRGVTKGHVAERLYREVRALRIYEGTSEIQRLVIARQLLEAGH